jgi:hypothetical protein
MRKANGKTTTYHFSWIVSLQKQRYHICEMLPLVKGRDGSDKMMRKKR